METFETIFRDLNFARRKDSILLNFQTAADKILFSKRTQPLPPDDDDEGRQKKAKLI